MLDRIEATGGVSSVEVFHELVREVQAITEEHVTLALDRGERLRSGGVDLLLDLVDEPLDGLRLILAVADDAPGGHEVLERLSRGATQIPQLALAPFGGDDVLVIAPAVGREQAEAIAESSRGLLQGVADALSLHERAPEAAASEDATRALAATLSPEAGRALSALAVRPFRPSNAAIERFLDVDAVAWTEVAAELDDLLEPVFSLVAEAGDRLAADLRAVLDAPDWLVALAGAHLELRSAQECGLSPRTVMLYIAVA